MIKLIRNICCILIISSVAVGLLNIMVRPYIKTDRFAEYDNWEIEEMPDSIAYVNFGSSHGQRSFKYSALGDRVHDASFNFGTTSQSLVYDYFWASQYEGRLNAENGVAFITVSYFTLYQDEMTDGDFVKKNQRYYPHLDKAHMREWNLKDALLYGRLYRTFPILQFVDKQIGNIFYFDNDWLPEEMKKQMADLDKDSEPVIVEENLNALENLIMLLKRHNYRVILITTPVQDAFRDEYSRTFLDKFSRDMEEITAENGVEYWNFEHYFDGNTDVFIDTHHLSEEGASEFTRMLFGKLPVL